MIGKIHSTILLFLFLSFGSIYTFIFGGEILVLGLLVLSSVSILLKPRYNALLLKDFLIATSLMLSIIVFNWFVTGFSFSFVEYPKYMLRVVAVNLAIFAFYNFRGLSYKDFEWMFKVVVIHALLNFILGFIFHFAFLSVESSSGFKTSTLLYLFFYMAEIDLGGLVIYRNQGFFWEPGVLSFILNMYLFLLLLIKGDAKRNSIIIAVVCFLILTTFSTTGLGMMVLLLGVYFFKGKLNIKKLAILAIPLVIMVPFFISNLKEKKSGSGELSYLMRYYDSLIAIDVTLNHPLTGIGLSFDKYYLEQEKYPRFYQSDLEEGRANTNSILSVFFFFGIPIGILIMYALYRQKIFPNRKLIFVFFLIFLASEPLIFSSFFLVLICSAFYRPDQYNITDDTSLIKLSS